MREINNRKIEKSNLNALLEDLTDMRTDIPHRRQKKDRGACERHKSRLQSMEEVQSRSQSKDALGTPEYKACYSCAPEKIALKI